MKIPDIDFSKIRPYQNSRNAGFEELCCQLASLEPYPAGSVFFRKGVGGDAGVECYVQLPNGKETGWQAKYVTSWSFSLASDLNDSIATALRKHPKLTTYIVCLPFDLPDARSGRGKSPLAQWQKWTEKWKAEAKKGKRNLKIELWSKSSLAERLARDDPAYVGRLAFWFDREALTPAWFKQQFAKAKAALACLLADRLKIAIQLITLFQGVNDLYVLERLFAAIYGAVLQGAAKNGLSELSQTVYSIVFSGNAPPVNILLRDHARGIIEYIAWRDHLGKSIDMAKVRPPYRSKWPIEYVSDDVIATYEEDYGEGKRFGDRIVSSTINDGDFARYVIDRVVSNWSPAPIQAQSVPTDRDLCKSWFSEFKTWANVEQKAAFKAILCAAKTNKGEPGWKDTPERKQLQSAEKDFRQVIGSDAWEAYRVRAQIYVNYTMFSALRGGMEHIPKFKWPRRAPYSIKFDNGWARRWVCKRAHDLGWTAERFKKFERYTYSRDGYDRHGHRVERIGKKYQWLALHELTARMADNLLYLRGSRDKPESYEGTRQVGIRDIDPSLLVTKTHYDGWKQWPKTWWVPAAPALKSIPPDERLIWLDNGKDIINDQSLIDVIDPRSGQRWLVLEGFADWKQSGIFNGRRELERDTWFRLKCVVVKKSDEEKLIQNLRNRTLTSDHDLPSINLYGEHYIGEYPWHPTLSELSDWIPPDSWSKLTVPTRPTVAEYTQERSGYDYSIDKTISVSLPAPWLMRALKLRLADGRRLMYLGDNERVVFFDPSVSESGPRAALIDREVFTNMLTRENLVAVWVISGEKGVYGGRDPRPGFGGRLLHTYVYHIKNGKFRCYKHVERELASQEQLKNLLGRDVLIIKGTRKIFRTQSKSSSSRKKR